MKIRAEQDRYMCTVYPCVEQIQAQLMHYQFQHNGRPPARIFVTSRLLELIHRQNHYEPVVTFETSEITLLGIPVRDFHGPEGDLEYFFSDEEA